MGIKNTIDGKQAWPAKGAAETLDYGYVFTPRMSAGDYLVSFTATVTEGSVSKNNEGVTTIYPYPRNHAGMVWLEGGSPGEVCTINLNAVTANGDIFDTVVKLPIKP